MSKTITVFKKGYTLAVSYYRPISLLSNIIRIFEKLISIVSLKNKKAYVSISVDLEKNTHTNKIKTLIQTIHTLISITDKIRDALDNKSLAIGIFIDFQKAFDTVNHDILLIKFDHYGIRALIQITL